MANLTDIAERKTTLKGKLTKLSIAAFALLQSPKFIAEVFEVKSIFLHHAEQPLDILSLAAGAGMIYGGIRRAFNYFK